MLVKVHLLDVYEGEGKVRRVNISDLTYPDAILDEVFYKGDNDHADSSDLNQRLPSVSSGDVIEHPEGVYHLVKSIGFKKMSRHQFVSYKKHMSRNDRHNILHFVNLGD